MLLLFLIKHLIEMEKCVFSFLSHNLLFSSGISFPHKLSSILQNKVAFYLKTFDKCSLSLGGCNLTNGFPTQTIISMIQND